MLERLRDNWVYGGFLVALLLLALTPVVAGSWSTGLILIWLQLPAYMLHQYEEHDGDRFRLFVNDVLGGGREVLTRLDTFIINIPGVWGIDGLAFALAAKVDLGLGLVAVYLSLFNALAHLAMAVRLGRYNPGLVTSLVIFLPLGAATLWVLAGEPGVALADHAIGSGLSVLIHGAIVSRVLARKRRQA